MSRAIRITAFVGLLCLVLTACGARVVPLSAPQAAGQPLVDPNTGQTIFPTAQPTGVGTGQGGVPTGPATVRPTSGPLADCRPAGATDVGVTNDTIRIGMVVAENGSFKGQFNSNIEAVDAYFKLINADEGGICGRKIQLFKRDDGGNANNDLVYARELAEEVKVFAFVGSISAPDSDTGVSTMSRKYKIPDIGFPLTYERTESPYTYGVPGQLQKNLIGEGCGGCRYLIQSLGIKQVAVFWLGESLVSKANAWAYESAALKAGAEKICYTRETTVFDQNWDSYAIAVNGACPASDGPLAIFSVMENTSNIKLAGALRKQGVPYKAFAPTFTSYLRSFVVNERGAPRPETEGAYIAMPQIPFERCAGTDSKARPVPPCAHPELERYVRALRRFNPNFVAPGSWGAPGWGQAALFVTAAKACGARLTRACVLSQLNSMGPFSVNGFLTPTRPSDRKIYTADLVTQVRNGRFVEMRPNDKSGPPQAPDFWDKSVLFDWWVYYCGHKSRFPEKDRDDMDAFIKC